MSRENERITLQHAVNSRNWMIILLSVALFLALLGILAEAGAKREYIVIEDGVARFIGQVPPEIRKKEVALKAKEMAELYYNWTPETVADHYNTFLSMTSAGLRKKITDVLQKNKDISVAKKISEQFIPESIEVLSLSPTIQVQIIGTQQLIGSNIETKRIKVLLIYQDDERTTDNQAGLLLTSIQEEGI